jgi:aspartyl-tRNA(Asn)/glutamyl-tRNA(Gln) amidotransferase subunit A
MKLYEKTAAELSAMLGKKEVSAVEVVRSFAERIEEVDPVLKAFVTPTPAEALETAGEVDSRRANGEKLHPLAGVPLAIKDNISTSGIKTTCSSKILHNYIPPYDATVVRLFKEVGMPLLGKTNMDEFAMGSSTENSAFFTSRNPWDPKRVPGGSSGGSAVAVSSGMSPLALGSDTGGSVRQPSSFCGLIGLRPTYGRVSRYGLIAFASSLDQIGPITLTAEDSALLLGVIAGYDPLDSTSLPHEIPDYCRLLDSDLRGLKIGIIKENISEQFDPEVNAGVLKMVGLLEQGGAEVDEVSLPLTDYGLGAYYLIAPSEASSNLGRYDGVRYGYNAGGSCLEEMFSRTRGEGFGAEVKRRIIVGTYALSAGYYDAYYLQAMKVRTLIRRDYEQAFNKYDLILGATTPTPAFKIGEKSDDPVQMYLSDVCNINDALAGIPSISIPSGMHSSGLPMGLQMAAPPSGEALLLKVAHFLDQKCEADSRRPQLNYDEGGSCQ